MNTYRLNLYKRASKKYRVKLANPVNSYFNNMSNGSTFTPFSGTLLNGQQVTGAQDPWYKVRFFHPNGNPNGWAWLGAIGTAIPMTAVGYNAGHAAAKKLGWDENGWGTRILSGVGALGGAYFGAQIGKYSMLPFQLSGRITNALGGGLVGNVAGIGTAIGGTALYSGLTNKGIGYAGQTATNAVNNTAMSRGDASRYLHNVGQNMGVAYA